MSDSPALVGRVGQVGEKGQVGEGGQVGQVGDPPTLSKNPAGVSPWAARAMSTFCKDKFWCTCLCFIYYACLRLGDAALGVRGCYVGMGWRSFD